MSIRSLLRTLGIVLFALLAVASPALSADTIRASGFGSTGIAMGTWRWLANDRGDAYVTWTFTDSRIPTDDLHLHFKGLAAFAPDSGGSIGLRIHYGFPGTAQLGGVYAQTDLTLAAQHGEAGIVGAPVAGDLLITADMLDALTPAARQLSIRIEQSENPGVSVAFRREDLTITPSSAGGEDEGENGDLDHGAAGFASNGDYIQTWYWLRDSALRHYASWRIDDVAVSGGGVPLSITALATSMMSGPPGIDAEFSLRYGTNASVLEGRGGATMSVHLPNVSPPNDPVGYTNQDVVVLPASRLGGAGREVTLYLRVERESAQGPHVAFNAASMRVGEEGGEDGAMNGEDGIEEDGTQDDGTAENGTEDGVALAIEVTDGGRTLTSTAPFLVAADKVGDDAVDPDHDGVLQAFEDLAMARLNPIVELDENENWIGDRDVDNVINFVSVTPYPSVQVPRYLVVMYATTWARDYGRDTIPLADAYNQHVAQRHNGDIEKVVEAWEIVSSTRAELRHVYTSAHAGATLHNGVWAAAGSSCNAGKVVASPDQTICATLQFETGRLKVAASQGKHAYYPTVDACEEVRLIVNLGTGIGEDCGQGETVTFPVYNFGEKAKPLLTDIDFLFAGETTSEDFCGGHSSTYFSGFPCVGKIEDALDGPPNLLAEVLLRAPRTLPDGTGQMYEHASFAGFSVGLNTSTSIGDMTHLWGGTTNVNDMISSIKLGRGISCTFYPHANYEGTPLGPLTFADATDGEWPNLSAQGMNDKISSVQCQ